MTTETPRHARTTSRWTKARAAGRRVLTLEPVAVQGVVRSAFVLAGAVGLGVADHIQTQALAAIAAGYALAETAGTVWARSKVIPTAKTTTDAGS